MIDNKYDYYLNGVSETGRAFLNRIVSKDEEFLKNKRKVPGLNDPEVIPTIIARSGLNYLVMEEKLMDYLENFKSEICTETVIDIVNAITEIRSNYEFFTDEEDNENGEYLYIVKSATGNNRLFGIDKQIEGYYNNYDDAFNACNCNLYTTYYIEKCLLNSKQEPVAEMIVDASYYNGVENKPEHNIYRIITPKDKYLKYLAEIDIFDYNLSGWITIYSIKPEDFENGNSQKLVIDYKGIALEVLIEKPKLEDYEIDTRNYYILIEDPTGAKHKIFPEQIDINSIGNNIGKQRHILNLSSSELEKYKSWIKGIAAGNFYNYKSIVYGDEYQKYCDEEYEKSR